MSQILVRNLKTKVVRGLKNRAARQGRSLQSEVKIILDRETGGKKMTPEEAVASAREIQRHYKPGRAPDVVQLIREDRDR